MTGSDWSEITPTHVTEFVCRLRGGRGGMEARGLEVPDRSVSLHRVHCVGKEHKVLLQTLHPSSSEPEHVGGPDLSWQSRPAEMDAVSQ